MKDIEDKIIQEAAEKGIDIPEHQDDIKTYRFLFNALKEEEEMPSFPASFAEKIADRLEKRAVTRVAFKESLWKAGAIVVFLLTAAIALAGVGMGNEILQSMASIKWYLIIAAFLLLLTEFVDKQFVRKAV